MLTALQIAVSFGSCFGHMTDKETEHCNEKVKSQSPDNCNPHRTEIHYN